MDIRPDTVRIDTSAVLRTLFVVCVSVEMLLFTLDYFVNWAGPGNHSALRRLFSTSREDGLAGWVAILQTAMIALTLWIIYALVRRQGNRFRTLGWLALAIFFSYLTLDDGAHIHERIGTAYHDTAGAVAAGAWSLEMFPSYRWQIVFMPLFAAMGIFMMGFLARELRGWKPRLAVFLALGCLAGAVTLDFFEGLDSAHPWNPYTAIAAGWQLDYWAAKTFNTTAYATLLHFSKSIEECTEMFAMSVLWMVFLGHLAGLGQALRIRCVMAGEAPLRIRRPRPERAPGTPTPAPDAAATVPGASEALAT